MILNNLTIYQDDVQEGLWFQQLNPNLAKATLKPITGALKANPKLSTVLAYDRPDIILAHNDDPILVVERTIEVPSGHNVGQRFARLVAAAEARVPSVYFFPYVARKHGGETEGPRYVNLRLFYALDVMTQRTGSAVTTINWPVDAFYEVRRDPEKDTHMKEYMEIFLEQYIKLGIPGVNGAIIKSRFHRDRILERETFAKERVREPEQYDSPPPSVQFLSVQEAANSYNLPSEELKDFDEVMVYQIGSTYLRSDPYAGMAMLYRYLYVSGEPGKQRGTLLHMPQIDTSMWQDATSSPRERKDVRLFRLVSDGILFGDGYLPKRGL